MEDKTQQLISQLFSQAGGSTLSPVSVKTESETHDEFPFSAHSFLPTFDDLNATAYSPLLTTGSHSQLDPSLADLSDTQATTPTKQVYRRSYPTRDQRDMMDEAFKTNPNPTKEEVQALSERTQLSPTRLSRYFFNRRYSLRFRFTNFTDLQQAVLTSFCNTVTDNPDQEQLQSISTKLSLDPKQVSDWFKKKRNRPRTPLTYYIHHMIKVDPTLSTKQHKNALTEQWHSMPDSTRADWEERFEVDKKAYKEKRAREIAERQKAKYTAARQERGLSTGVRQAQQPKKSIDPAEVNALLSNILGGKVAHLPVSSPSPTLCPNGLPSFGGMVFNGGSPSGGSGRSSTVDAIVGNRKRSCDDGDEDIEKMLKIDETPRFTTFQDDRLRIFCDLNGYNPSITHRLELCTNLSITNTQLDSWLSTARKEMPRKASAARPPIPEVHITEEQQAKLVEIEDKIAVRDKIIINNFEFFDKLVKRQQAELDGLTYRNEELKEQQRKKQSLEGNAVAVAQSQYEKALTELDQLRKEVATLEGSCDEKDKLIQNLKDENKALESKISLVKSSLFST